MLKWVFIILTIINVIMYSGNQQPKSGNLAHDIAAVVGFVFGAMIIPAIITGILWLIQKVVKK